MSTLNNILNKINKAEKTELSKHEVALGLVDDIVKLSGIASKSINSFLNTYKIINAQKDKAIADGESYYKIAAQIQNVLKEFAIKAKELGIDVNENKDYKAANDLLLRYDIQAVFDRVDSLRKIK